MIFWLGGRRVCRVKMTDLAHLKTPRGLRAASALIALSALLHLIGYGLSGFDPVAMIFPPVAVLYGLFAWGLAAGWRWLAWPVFIVMLFGAVVAYVMTGTTAVPDATLLAISAADLAVALSLFTHIWARD